MVIVHARTQFIGEEIQISIRFCNYNTEIELIFHLSDCREGTYNQFCVTIAKSAQLAPLAFLYNKKKQIIGLNVTCFYDGETPYENNDTAVVRGVENMLQDISYYLEKKLHFSNICLYHDK